LRLDRISTYHNTTKNDKSNTKACVNLHEVGLCDEQKVKMEGMTKERNKKKKKEYKVNEQNAHPTVII
jgi:hypothetical protein